jgi:PAS domain S-box-containing protein
MSNNVFVDSDHALKELSDIIRGCEQEIYNKWIDCLKSDPKYKLTSKANLVNSQKNQGSFIVDLLENGCQWSDKQIKSYLEKVRQVDYSIKDLFSEMNCVQNAIEEIILTKSLTENARLKAFKGMSIFRSSLFYLFETILENTSLFYELTLEKGITGFCQIDINGVIVFSNQQLVKLAEAETLEGLSFEVLFSGSHKNLIKSVLFSGKEKLSLLQQAPLTSLKGKIIPVGLELSPVTVNDSHLGFYAKITDLTKPMELQNRIFDKFLLGIVRLDQERRITYTNQSFRDLLGLDCEEWKGLDFNELVIGDENRRIIEEQLKKRFKGKSDEYNIKLCRRDISRTIPVRISASPEMDLQGEVIGTMGIVRSIVRDTMYRHIEQQNTADDLLTAISDELISVVPFDNLYISLFSSDMKHVRPFFKYSTDKIPHIEKRWWEMTPDMIVWAKQKEIVAVQDHEAFYEDAKFRHLKKEPVVNQLIKLYKSFIYYPIFRDNKVVACMNLYSKSEKPYGNSHRRLLKGLPLDTAVLTALHYDEKKELEFCINLLKSISALGNDLNKIADTIINKIAENYEWENVSIFKFDRSIDKFFLLKQVALSNEFKIRSDFTQSKHKGILGLAYKEQKTINVNNVDDPKWKDVYIMTVPATKSELCLPIRSGDLFWLLNIEDHRVNAFSVEEIKSLESLINQFSVFIERAWLSNFLHMSMKETSDAVIAINFHGNITFINRAATDLLGYDENALLGERLRRLLVDKNMEKFIIETSKIPNTSVTFLTKQNTEIKLLLSKFRLHEEFNTNIIIAKSLELQNRLEELNYLKKLYSEIAFQTKTPLTLVFSWLNKLKRKIVGKEVHDTIDKIFRQLSKVELTYDRLALYDKDKTEEPDFPYNQMMVSIKEIWQHICQSFPHGELERVHFDCKDENISFFGDLFQIIFCFETILSYLMRSIPGEEKILVKGSIKDRRLQIRIKGDMPKIVNDQNFTDISYASGKTLIDLALGESIIRQFIGNSGGVYYKPEINKEKIEFNFNFPLAEENDHG